MTERTRALFKTEKNETLLIHLIFIITFAASTTSGIIEAMAYSYFEPVFESILLLLPLASLFVACILYIKKTAQPISIILAALCASWYFLRFIINWTKYRYYYDMLSIAIDVFASPALIAGIILLIIHQAKTNKGRKAKKLHFFMFIAGIVYLFMNSLSVFTILRQFIYYSRSFGYCLRYFFQYIVLAVPEWFIVLALWLVADMRYEQEEIILHVENPVEEIEGPQAPDILGKYAIAVRDWAANPPTEDGEYLIWFIRSGNKLSARKLVFHRKVWTDTDGEEIYILKSHPALWIKLPVFSEDVLEMCKKR